MCAQYWAAAACYQTPKEARRPPRSATLSLVEVLIAVTVDCVECLLSMCVKDLTTKPHHAEAVNMLVCHMLSCGGCIAQMSNAPAGQHFAFVCCVVSVLQMLGQDGRLVCTGLYCQNRRRLPCQVSLQQASCDDNSGMRCRGMR